MKLSFFLLLIVLFIFPVFSFKELSLSDYLEYKKLIKISKNINQKKIDKLILLLCNEKCNYWKNGQNYYFSPNCLVKGCDKVNNKKYMPFNDAINMVWPFVSGFTDIYKLHSKNFYYFSTKPKFFYKYDLNKIITDNVKDKILLALLYSKGYYIRIPKIFLAFQQIKNYSFYVSGKNLLLRNKSRLNNFNVAMNKIDGFVLYPGKELNFNKLIANLPGYEKKNPRSHYLFYGGVCGVSTMLFRNSLINPYIYVKERYNHSQWYVYFYDKYIRGDDAALYQRIKKLVIKNISDYPIYFKKKQIGNELYFVSIVPKNVDDFTLIKKYQIGKLSAYLESDTFNKFGILKYKQSWISNYVNKNYEK